ncbi:hypothetical protein E6O75_ATG05896 [Venturia nashicola]|uniref:Uncharacterized protein n=1 Tax=Venturia nashicola TaxID=86259 RepID=A0A4Z1P3L0_9PEZI|nr:hypothetical protein E6O75_ATG05896 [Venturia nashicola]
MSPIPQAPLEYYGTSIIPGKAAGNGGWIGRSPPEMPVVRRPVVEKARREEKIVARVEIMEVPQVVLIPATPGEISGREKERRLLRGVSRREGEYSGKGKERESGWEEAEAGSWWDFGNGRFWVVFVGGWIDTLVSVFQDFCFSFANSYLQISSGG